MTITNSMLDHADLEAIAQNVADWTHRHYDFARRQAVVRGNGAGCWAEIVGLGWPALPIAERYGGLGGTTWDLAFIAPPLGRALLAEPFFSTVVLGAHLVDRFGSDDQKARLLPQVAAGKLKLAFAGSEAPGWAGFTDIACRAEVGPDGIRLTGQKPVVHDADTCDLLIVIATEATGLALHLVDRRAQGLAMTSARLLDGSNAADLRLVAVPAERLGDGALDPATLEAALAPCLAYLGNEALGIADALFTLTVEHLRTRRQFGRPLGANQALQHRTVDMLIQLECLRSLALECRGVPVTPQIGLAAARACKAHLARSALWIARQAVQLHGGMGVSDDMPIGHYFRRLLTIDATLGNARYHLRRLSAWPEDGRGALSTFVQEATSVVA